MIVTVTFLLVTMLLSFLYETPSLLFTSSYSTISLWSLLFFLFLFAIARSTYIIIAVRPRHLTVFLLNDLKSFLSIERVANAIPVLLLLPFFFAAFTAAKNIIPIINPFSWDVTLSNWDRTLHLGFHPWEWLHEPLAALGLTLLISFCYRLWFIVKVIVIYWQAFSLTNESRREEFFVALIATWIINGFILATLLSSAGPIYFHLVVSGSNSPYLSLIEYLREVQIYDLPVQEGLWDAYSNRTAEPLSGISAAPSMHVSVACLYALHGWRYGGIIRWGFLAFLFVTFVGSIHLAWHYAIDGYIAILSTSLIWVATKKLLRWARSPNSHSDEYRASARANEQAAQNTPIG